MAKPPVVLFLVPNKYTMAYTAMMQKLSTESLASLGREPNEVELTGFVSPNAEYGSVTLHFLHRSGIGVYDVIALVLFGETGDQFEFHSSDANDCVLGNVIIADLSVSIPTLCIPSLDTGWLSDPLNWENIKFHYTSLIKNGRKELTGSNPYNFVTRGNANWN